MRRLHPPKTCLILGCSATAGTRIHEVIRSHPKMMRTISLVNWIMWVWLDSRSGVYKIPQAIARDSVWRGSGPLSVEFLDSKSFLFQALFQLSASRFYCFPFFLSLLIGQCFQGTIKTITQGCRAQAAEKRFTRCNVAKRSSCCIRNASKKMSTRLKFQDVEVIDKPWQTMISLPPRLKRVLETDERTDIMYETIGKNWDKICFCQNFRRVSRGF